MAREILVSKMSYDRERERWYADEGEEKLRHEPDAFFTLRLPEQQRDLHCFYEADRRRTTNPDRIRRKLRAHFEFIVKQRRHTEHYNVDHITAVLTEAPDRNWANRLIRQARHPIISLHKPSPLFCETTDGQFAVTAPDDGKARKPHLIVTTPQAAERTVGTCSGCTPAGSPTPPTATRRPEVPDQVLPPQFWRPLSLPNHEHRSHSHSITEADPRRSGQTAGHDYARR